MQTQEAQRNSPAAPMQLAAGKYLTFTLGNEHFGIRVLKVREIIGIQDITYVPHSPPFVKGVINLRGKIVPVIDLRQRFDLAEQEITEHTCIIVVHVSGASEPVPMGLMVDGVAEVLNIAETDIEKTPDFGGDVDTSYLLGIAKARNQVTLLLDIDRALGSDEFQALQSVTGMAS